MIVRLEDVCFAESSSLKQSDLIKVKDGYPVYGASGFIANIDKYQQEKPYVSIVKDGAGVGRVQLCPGQSSVIGTMQYIIPKENVLPEYLYYVTTYMHLEKYYTGATIPHIYFKNYKKEKFNLDPIEKQKNIVKILDGYRKIIELRQEQLQKYDDLIKSRFVEIFGELSSNPYGWETFTMGECFDITSSKRILKSEWRAQGIPFLRVRDIVQLATTGQMENEYFVSEEFYKSLSDYDGVPQRGDILVSATSTLGKCHVVGEEERYYFKDADVLRFRAKKKINPIFFVELMKEHYIEEQISKTLGITTVAHFTIKAAKNINMRCPDIELQNEFANFVAQVDKSKLMLCRYNVNVNK